MPSCPFKSKYTTGINMRLATLSGQKYRVISSVINSWNSRNPHLCKRQIENHNQIPVLNSVAILVQKSHFWSLNHVPFFFFFPVSTSRIPCYTHLRTTIPDCKALILNSICKYWVDLDSLVSYVCIITVAVSGGRGPLSLPGLLGKGQRPSYPSASTLQRPANSLRYIQSLPGRKNVCNTLFSWSFGLR